jgi:D-glycero-D-manno-heptose 1,7-bisphosphate phosphatase
VNRAVFLDRDGVMNEVVLRNGRPYPPPSLDELVIPAGTGEAIAALRDAGFRLIVATNQPDVATGVQRREVVEAIHDRLCELFPLDAVKVCYHVDRDQCSCRKPKPGMLLEAAKEWSVDLARSFMIGDRWRDIEAGRNAGCKTILVGSGYGEACSARPNAVAASLWAASQLILSNRVPDRDA